MARWRVRTEEIEDRSEEQKNEAQGEEEKYNTGGGKEKGMKKEYWDLLGPYWSSRKTKQEMDEGERRRKGRGEEG